ncbi:hypothetical protein FA95DRAFT_411216 [Auriscalpium vulgare]|uniref:Uncharacterized protein n=1 Tax=Auriscalpium vulgare TaxID=40419 RepID=A0ACB8RGR1_9AGAM|nr:hypothetical protein FA95DRAFT_411216 [Auriscalpium vulgare]
MSTISQRAQGQRWSATRRLRKVSVICTPSAIARAQPRVQLMAEARHTSPPLRKHPRRALDHPESPPPFSPMEGSLKVGRPELTAGENRVG